MPSCYTQFRTDALNLSELSDESLRVFLALLTRSDDLREQVVTISELASISNVSDVNVVRALASLQSSEPDPLLKKRGKTLSISKHILGSAADKKFIWEEQANQEGRIRELEAINVRLCRQLAVLKANDESGLADELPPDVQGLVRDIEYQLARGLNPKEIYYLGQMVLSYGPDHVLKQVKKFKDAKDPLRSAYGFLNGVTKRKQLAKKTFEVPEERTYTYYELT